MTPSPKNDSKWDFNSVLKYIATNHWFTAKKGGHQFRFFLSNMRTPKTMAKQGKIRIAHVGKDNSLIFFSTLVYTLGTGRT